MEASLSDMSPTSLGWWSISLFRWQAFLSFHTDFAPPGETSGWVWCSNCQWNCEDFFPRRRAKQLHNKWRGQGTVCLEHFYVFLRFCWNSGESCGQRRWWSDPQGQKGNTSEVSIIYAKALSFLFFVVCADLDISVVEIAIQQTRLPCHNCT